jgi:hypothetical protein
MPVDPEIVVLATTRWLIVAALIMSTFVYVLTPKPFRDITFVVPSINASVCENMPLYLKLAEAVVLVHGPNSPPCPGATNMDAPFSEFGAANRFLGANHVKTRLLMSLDSDLLPHRWSVYRMRAELLQHTHGHVGNWIRRCDVTGYYPNKDDATDGNNQIVLTGMSLHYAEEMRAITKSYFTTFADQLRRMGGNGEDILYNQVSVGRPSLLSRVPHALVFKKIPRVITTEYKSYSSGSNHDSWRSTLCHEFGGQRAASLGKTERVPLELPTAVERAEQSRQQHHPHRGSIRHE